ncbi:MAG: AbrB/MazE/SpoVT family DNA-binding domain-containing protein [Duodenibacillus sp.]
MSNRLTIKGQVTVPKEVREFLGLTSGASAVEFSIEDDGSVRITKATLAPRASGVRRAVSLRASASNDRCARVLALLNGCVAA